MARKALGSSYDVRRCLLGLPRDTHSLVKAFSALSSSTTCRDPDSEKTRVAGVDDDDDETVRKLRPPMSAPEAISPKTLLNAKPNLHCERNETIADVKKRCRCKRYRRNAPHSQENTLRDSVRHHTGTTASAGSHFKLSTTSYRRACTTPRERIRWIRRQQRRGARDRRREPEVSQRRDGSSSMENGCVKGFEENRGRQERRLRVIILSSPPLLTQVICKNTGKTQRWKRAYTGIGASLRRQLLGKCVSVGNQMPDVRSLSVMI